MTDPSILELTASEPLSMLQQFGMMHEWYDDPSKITFIITSGRDAEAESDAAAAAAAAAATPTPPPPHAADASPVTAAATSATALATDGTTTSAGGSSTASALGTTRATRSQVAAMAGDVNLFFNDLDDAGTAEVDVMVAEHAFRSRGFATEALQVLMRAASERLGVTSFRAKIKSHNVPSLGLFAKLGFVEEQRVEVFDEVHLVFGKLAEEVMTAAAQTDSRTGDGGGGGGGGSSASVRR
jgi:hypothetical protein